MATKKTTTTTNAPKKQHAKTTKATTAKMPAATKTDAKKKLSQIDAALAAREEKPKTAFMQGNGRSDGQGKALDFTGRQEA
ncbi:hypothetical protein [Novipirellula artificiosorum]|uniref:Uncharacterized protein n=1 Tax=Novipirellula artificiosorum TaxID=2528016 RepID=A0A5C6D914_9BACT|nr:hypothetical protein [Novipirellula artificiosorum]TWU32291.1 hypothetical protein Poly41_57770 [Novipirellula artificiosorum]